MIESKKNVFVSSTLGIALIIFFLGFFLIIGILGYTAPELAKQELVLRVMLKPNVPEDKALLLQKKLEKEKYIRYVYYVSKEEALKRFDLGKEYLEALDGVNPLPPALEIKLKAEYTDPKIIRKIAARLIEYDEVQEVDYPLKLIIELTQRRKLYFILSLSLGVLLAFITFLLIYNMIKLAILSKRFLIRTMELIGATRDFISKPFIQSAVAQSFIAALLADLMLFGLIKLIATQIPSVNILLTINSIKILFLSLPLVSILMGLFAGKMALNKYLGKELEKIV